MLRVGEHLGGRPDLDDLAEVHHADAVAHVLDRVDVVRDEQVRQVELVLQVVEQLQDLRAHRQVERRGRLVQHDELRACHDRAGDADALLLAAGQLRGQLFGVVEQAESGERLFRHFMRFGGRVAVHFLQRQRDVPAGGEMGKQVELLEEKPVFSAIRLERRGI